MRLPSRRRRLGRAPRGRLRDLVRNHDPERCALSQFALHGDPASEPFQGLPDDGQPEAGSLVAADRVLGKLAEIAFGQFTVANRDRLRALDMLAKHVGIYDRQQYEYPEFLSEKVKCKRFLDSIPEKYKYVFAICTLLGPEENEVISQAIEEIGRRHFGPPGSNNEEYTGPDLNTPSGMIEFMKETLGAARIKRSIKSVLDGLLTKEQRLPTRMIEKDRITEWMVREIANDWLVNGESEGDFCRRDTESPAPSDNAAPRKTQRSNRKKMQHSAII